MDPFEAYVGNLTPREASMAGGLMPQEGSIYTRGYPEIPGDIEGDGPLQPVGTPEGFFDTDAYSNMTEP